MLIRKRFQTHSHMQSEQLLKTKKKGKMTHFPVVYICDLTHAISHGRAGYSRDESKNSEYTF